jgi:tetraacyldisaccharide 4'-kinase
VTKQAGVSELPGAEPGGLSLLHASALGGLYAGVAGVRRRWYERHPEARRRLTRPVISVGNLSVGGTGKTPLAMMIAEWLLAQGERPAIVSRGYKRADPVDGVVVVSDGQRVLADLSHAGDEPLMMARAVPRAIVCVAEERHLAGVIAERRLGATVHILDDGFQHVQLARDFDVLVTSPGEITSGRPLPLGRLRESRDAAARADFVVVVNADIATARAEAWELGVSAYAAAHRTLGHPGAAGCGWVRPGAGGASGAGGAPGAAGASLGVAVAGIGNPAQFFAMLRSAGYRVETTMAFADHHRYTPSDVARIAAATQAAGATVVWTTQKDAVRFEPLGQLPFSLMAIPMRLRVDNWDSLTASLEQTVRRVRGVT